MTDSDQTTTTSRLRRMAEATRLTRTGRLNEATALIQRSLGGAGGGSPSPSPSPTPPDPTRVPATVVRTERRAGAAGPRTSGAAGAPTQRASAQPAAGGGEFVARTVTTAAGTRSYGLYVPGGRAGTALPLIVMLHGCTQNAADFATGTRMNLLAERHGFLVAYPEQSQQANPQRCWNWFQAADQQRDRGEPAIIAELVRTVVGSHEVDLRRVHVAGMSAGAAMAVVMATTYPDLFAAVGVHSGLAYGAARDLASALQAMKRGDSVPPPGGPTVPTIVFHGDQDRTVHRGNGEQILRQATAHVAHPLLTVHDQVDGGRTSTRYVYCTPDGRSLAEGWSVSGLGHAWSGGDPAGSHTDPRGPDASVEMVRFFADHQRSQ
ncbi:PHB depolymerase family esterase [soil metagenome]